MSRKALWLGVATLLLAGGLVVLLYYALWRRDGEGRIELQETTIGGRKYTALMREEIDWGGNFDKPADPRAWGHPEHDWSRWPTTYYHHESPVGLVLERFKWFREHGNVYSSDARLPASLTVLAVADLGAGNLPLSTLVGTWSEPPIAVIGMGAGTIASYARPFQHIHFYERADAIVKFSAPRPGERPVFHYLKDAERRGAAVRVVSGDERAALAQHGPERFYHVLVVEPARGHPSQIVVERITKEALALYRTKLAPDGIVCFHTSNRSYDLAPALASTAHDAGLSSRKGYDQLAHDEHPGRVLKAYTSDWIMIAPEARKLHELADPRDFDARRRRVQDQRRREGVGFLNEPFWSTPMIDARYVLTDADASALRELRRNP